MLHYWKRLVYNDIDIVVWYIADTGSSVLQYASIQMALGSVIIILHKENLR